LEELKEPSADVNEGLHSCAFKHHEDEIGLNISSHCWIKNSKTLVITTKWEIFIFKDFKLWQMIHYEFPEEKVGSIIADKLKDRNHLDSQRAGLEKILRMLSRGDNTDLMMKTRKKMNNDGREIDEDDSEFQNSDSEENPMEEDEGLQDVLDEIKNENSDKELMID
jgi:WD40 repeat protein